MDRRDVKRVGLGYCGGCNPVYDRERYVAAVRKAAGARVEWVAPDAEGVRVLLIIHGCERACGLEALAGPASGLRVVSVRDGRPPPEETVALLLRDDEDAAAPGPAGASRARVQCLPGSRLTPRRS